jgi:rRNA-processing protein FCF1
MMSGTVVENIHSDAAKIHSLLRELLADSSIHRWHDPNTDGFLYIGGHYAWDPLTDAGRRVQADALERYRRLEALFRVLLSEQPDDTLRDFDRHHAEVTDFLQHQGSLFTDSPKMYFDRATSALDSEFELLKRLYSHTEGRAIFVLDSNALIYNPHLEKWEFADAPQFSLVITAPVLGELDALKVNHRVETVRDKAEKVIRLLKELRRRAQASGKKLSDGVVLVTGVSEVVTVATEPQMDNSLPWFDPGNKDDQILAATIEVMRRNPRSAVVMVSRDINMQNKCEFAGIPFVEPPDPV